MTKMDEKSTTKNGFLQFVGKIPGIMPTATLFYCAIDKETPMMVRYFGLFALFYLAFPVDLIPDVLLIIMGVGALDDIAVIYMAYKFAQSHIKPHHRQQALDLFQITEEDLKASKGQ